MVRPGAPDLINIYIPVLDGVETTGVRSGFRVVERPGHRRVARQFMHLPPLMFEYVRAILQVQTPLYSDVVEFQSSLTAAKSFGPGQSQRTLRIQLD